MRCCVLKRGYSEYYVCLYEWFRMYMDFKVFNDMFYFVKVMMMYVVEGLY